MENLWQRFLAWLRALFSDQPAPPAAPAGLLPEPVTLKVLLVVYDPHLAEHGGQRLSTFLGWNDADMLVDGYIRDLQACSHGYLNYQVIDSTHVDGFPSKKDGFVYTAAQYLQVLDNPGTHHQPDLLDYEHVLADFDVLARINAGDIDEVWLFGMPYAGFYESRMAGPGAYFCNAPPLTLSGVQRRFIIMGFNYQRGVGEMLEAFGHRAEFILARIFQNTSGDANLWARFIRYDKSHPAQAECGNVHFAPNSQTDYDWGNPAFVPSRCRNWMTFPDLSAPPVLVNCDEWGGGDIRKHHTWWLSLFPHVTGQSNGIAWNWWHYITHP